MSDRDTFAILAMFYLADSQERSITEFSIAKKCENLAQVPRKSVKIEINLKAAMKIHLSIFSATL